MDTDSDVSSAHWRLIKKPRHYKRFCYFREYLAKRKKNKDTLAHGCITRGYTQLNSTYIHAYFQYCLKLCRPNFTGDAGNSMATHNKMKFSTKDVDNDHMGGSNCAQVYKGAWWYNACHSSNLNGQYLAGPHASYADGVNWAPFKGHYYSLKTSEMKVRPTV